MMNYKLLSLSDIGNQVRTSAWTPLSTDVTQTPPMEMTFVLSVNALRVKNARADRISSLSRVIRYLFT